MLAVGQASAFKLLGKSMFVLGAGLSFYQGAQAYRQGDYGGAAKSGVDIVMGGVGLMGPVGATTSAVYFGVDMTIGWDRVGRAMLPTPEEMRMNKCYYPYGPR